MIRQRILVGALSLSAAGFAGIALQEGYTEQAIVPVPGDPHTFGIGSTTGPDGKPVKAGDKIKPTQAIRLAVRDIEDKEVRLRACFGDVALYQHEYDAFVDLSYNVGVGAVCNSSIPKKLKAEQHELACNTILDFKSVQHRNCCLPANRRFCGGVCDRRKEMAALCLTGVRK
ncbi:glycoside hydrolase family protein [Ferribacterium limneticum]|uniref:glycoside hydrolase family protein n=1 Tax=Ferribacterium limneticum TaxID=76259 RepID=UPI001CF861B1|nr:glycoside hydrolase family protein [Ferribacterium limneticum]UCV26788.1 glycoside hydrolase family protein [Ferribacterium limneticum]UCV30705.1 glycoside hydrolase family protein [Ferribacterium limneticum]